ncbi:hypothetical protein BE20_25505 [Sorangium cellulosum]|uniref:Glycosyl hydrolase family 98 putative carbohydrate-binding module domain-containing protein n=1 Tax=Sorangium cellulosum TaxID=56 RepID=A0A150S5D3_SORCE|nr:hypothetical protein BE18_17070 [Sorangium cellulosum]KYF87607.1 hypothetical protein BE20_25505 [Sorangium cellulosum]
MAESGPMTGADEAKTLTADVTGATWLRLVAAPGDASASDHADWASSVVVCGGSSEPTTPEQTIFSFESGTEGWGIANADTGGTVSRYRGRRLALFRGVGVHRRIDRARAGQGGGDDDEQGVK